ncbi:MAG: competence/damage-inducible protein A [Alphaproteobacteria bacterium]|nr:competence/damage-inducible protein A [Alphaproteobacteria bacterium]
MCDTSPETTDSTDQIVTAAIIVIGDEILSGRTKDKNIGYIAEHCTNIGIQLKEVRIVPDDEAEIVDAVNTLRARYTYVFTTGGIGPTHDDITADCIAKAFGVGIDVDQRALDLMLPAFKKRGVEVTPARLRMARIPDGAELVENSISTAPGFMIGNVVTMAGIPSIMQVMLDAVTPRLRKGRMMHSRAIDLNQPEGGIADLLKAHQAEYPDVAMGSYPTMRDGRPCTQLVLRSIDAARLEHAHGELLNKLQSQSLID